jgi:hypothetical protein
MSFAKALPFLTGITLVVIGCDPAKVQEQEAAAAKAQAVSDSIVAAYQAQADSEAAALALDSTTVELDSGTWNIDEPGEQEYVEPTESGLVYEDWKHIADDTVAVERRRFDEAELDKYLEDPDLDYDRSRHDDNLWWTRFMRWLGEQLEKLFGTRGGRSVLNNLHWIVLGIAVLVVAWFFRKRLFGTVFGLDAKHARQVTEMPENIEELDLDKLLGDAEKGTNWRLALRYQWLKVLRKLVDEGRITWQPRFTDADYMAQLKEPALRVTFSELSFLFKWVWYGDAPMDAQRYQRMKPAFEAAHRQAPAKAEPAPTASAPNA